jgi:crotonobetainyl-CoA:carnitine CoA-transferase CaiB-like acyl-CoA transferase
MRGSLAGVKVIELGTYVAAPALGNMLGILGANVVKVEPPEGDPTRKTTPWSWANYNWNKRSVSLDLKTRAGIAAMKKLVGEADVFIESLSPRAIRELRLDYESVKRVNRRLVYCSIKGFAHDSSSSQRLGFDAIAQAEGGLMHVVRGEDGRPARVGNPCVDLTAATFGMVGVLVALLRRPRKATHIEVPLYDVVVYWNGYWLPYIDIHGEEPSHLGSSHPGFAPYGVFSVKDGFVFIGVLTDPQWGKLVEKLGLETPPLSAASERIRSRAQVNSMVQAAVGKYTTVDLLALLGEAVPCARVSTLAEIHDDEELGRRGTVMDVEYEGRPLRVALPPVLNQFVAKERSRLPALGESGASRKRRTKPRRR